MKKKILALMIGFLLIAVNLYAAGDLIVEGNVGIGITAPSAKLHLGTGTTGTVGLLIERVAGQTANYISLTGPGGLGTPTFSVAANGDMHTYGTMRFGDQTSYNSWLLLGSKTTGDDGTDLNTTEFIARRQNSFAFSGLTIGMGGTAEAISQGGDITGKIIGGNFIGKVGTDTAYYTNNTISEIIGVRGNITAGYVEGNQTTVTKAISVKGEGSAFDSSVNLDNAYNFYGAAHTYGTNQYGIWLEKQTAGGTTNAGIVLDGDGAGSDIVFGPNQETSIYSNAGELFAKDGAGNVTQISPHDPETGEWIFYSKNVKTGKVVRVDMEKLVKAVERLTGEKFMVEAIGEVKQ